MKTRKVAEEVLYSEESVTRVSREDIEELALKATATGRGRIRICTHPNEKDSLHEMLIVHPAMAYVRPHKHEGKSESFHMIGGELLVFVFGEHGDVRECFPMSSDGVFYYRLPGGLFHCIVPLSPQVIFHETTNGPFQRGDCTFAPWAPEESSPLVKEYMNALLKKSGQFHPHMARATSE